MARYSRKKKGGGIGFKFLIVSLLIIMFVIFIIGLQIGRVVEKTSKEGKGNRVVTKTFDEEDVGEKIRSDIASMREDGKQGDSASGLAPETAPVVDEKKPSAQRAKIPKQVDKQSVTKVPSSQRKKRKTAAVTRQLLFLQVGVFSVEKNADSMKRRLAKYGLKVTIETYKQSNGKVLRKVLVGPYSTASEVTKEREKIERLTGTKPVLVRRQR